MPAAHEQFQAGYFALEVDGLVHGFFQNLSGLERNTEVVDNWETTAEGRTINRKYPGKTTFGDITLRRGVTSNGEIHEWHKKVSDGKIERKNGSVVMYDSMGAEVARWNFENGFPTKTSIADLDASSGDIVVEELTIAHEFAERVK